MSEEPEPGCSLFLRKGTCSECVAWERFRNTFPDSRTLRTARDLLERVWKTSLPYGKGKTVPEMVRGLETGELRALYIAGADPLTDYPNAGRFASALEKADLVIVQDLFLSPTAKMAHCVLPAASFAEKEGTMTNIEHRIQKLNPVIPPLGQAIPDWSVFEEVARSLGRPMGFFKAADVFREMTLTIPPYKGLKLQDLQGDGKIVPLVPAKNVRLRGRNSYSFAPVRTWEGPEKEDVTAYPFELIAGRSMFHFGSFSTRSRNLLQLCPEGYLQINAADAEALGIKEGDQVKVSSQSASFVAPTKLSDKVDKGMVFVPTNFPGQSVYRLFEENTTVCRVKLMALGANAAQ